MLLVGLGISAAILPRCGFTLLAALMLFIFAAAKGFIIEMVRGSNIPLVLRATRKWRAKLHPLVTPTIVSLCLLIMASEICYASRQPFQRETLERQTLRSLALTRKF